jgi:allantoate deiminase
VSTINKSVKDICDERHLRFKITPLAESGPVSLSGEIIDLMEKKARVNNIESLRIVSGAGHDSALFADLTETGMVFVPSENGRSHCPEEFTRVEDIGLGCEILIATAIELSS